MLVYAPGVFDGLHIGHVRFLEAAAESGKQLIVGVQEDRAVLRFKGAMPLQSTPLRMECVRALRCVDDVVSYTSIDQSNLLSVLKPTTFAIGPEYGKHEEQRLTLDYCDQEEIIVRRVGRTEGVSSTELKSNAKRFWDSRGESVCINPGMLGRSSNSEEDSIRTKAEADAIIKSLGDDTLKTSIVELGCGNGRLLRELAQHFSWSIGLDYSMGMVDLAIENFFGVNADAYHCDVTNLDSHKYGPANVILFGGTLGYMSDPQIIDVLMRWKGVLCAGGSVLFREPMSTSGKRIVLDRMFSESLMDFYSIVYRTPQDFRQLAKRAGLKFVSEIVLDAHHSDSSIFLQRYME